MTASGLQFGSTHERSNLSWEENFVVLVCVVVYDLLMEIMLIQSICKTDSVGLVTKVVIELFIDLAVNTHIIYRGWLFVCHGGSHVQEMEGYWRWSLFRGRLGL